MQEQPIEAAPKVRQGLSTGMQGDVKGGRDVSPGLVSRRFLFQMACVDRSSRVCPPARSTVDSTRKPERRLLSI